MTEPSITFHPSAIEEAIAAYHWYKERDPSAAAAFLAEIDLSVDHIGRFPRSGSEHIHGTRKVVLRRFPFLIVYRERGTAVEVVALAHGRRKPGYWRSR